MFRPRQLTMTAPFAMAPAQVPSGIFLRYINDLLSLTSRQGAFS
jgi:hypothetical protein